MSPDSPQHEQIPWDAGRWLHPPVDVSVHEAVDNERMTVIAAEHSDAWRHTSYGFVHDDAHALLVPFPEGVGMEVSFMLDYTEQFDQAGVYLHVSSSHWVKAGVEVSDGVVQVGAVIRRQVGLVGCAGPRLVRPGGDRAPEPDRRRGHHSGQARR